jgi:hypothetical protein
MRRRRPLLTKNEMHYSKLRLLQTWLFYVLVYLVSRDERERVRKGAVVLGFKLNWIETSKRNMARLKSTPRRVDGIALYDY